MANQYVNKVQTSNGNTLIDLTGDTVQADKLMQGYTAHDKTGAIIIGTATGGSGQGNVWQDAQGYVNLDDESGISMQTKSVSPTESAQTVTPDSGYTGLEQVNVGAISSSYVGSGVTRQGATTYTPSNTAQTISSGKYLTGNQTIEAVVCSNLTAENIKNGVTVKVGTATDDDSVASVTGSYQGGGSGQYAWLGGSAEKVGRVVNIAINLKDDTGYDEWEASTTATTLIEANTDPIYTYSADVGQYDYCVITQGYIEPVYVDGTPMTTTTKRVCQYFLTYIYGYTTYSSSIGDIQQGVVTSTSTMTTTSTIGLQLFYNNTGALAGRSPTQCGPLYMANTPSISMGSVSNGIAQINYKLPAFQAKCDSSRFSTTRKEQVDSGNTNYLLTVDLYRVPHGNGIASHLYAEMLDVINA